MSLILILEQRMFWPFDKRNPGYDVSFVTFPLHVSYLSRTYFLIENFSSSTCGDSPLDDFFLIKVLIKNTLAIYFFLF